MANLSQVPQQGINVPAGDISQGMRQWGQQVGLAAQSYLNQSWVTAAECGAIGNGQNDDTAAIQKALNSGKGVVLGMPPVAWRITSLNVPSNVFVIGQGRRTKILHYGSSPLFNIQGSGVQLAHLYVDATNATAGSIFHLNTNNGSMEFITIDDVETVKANSLLTDDGHATNTVIMLVCRQLSSRQNKGRGVYLRNALAYLRMKQVTIDYIGSSVANANFVGFEFQKNRGAQIEECDVTGGATNGAALGNQKSFVLVDCQAMWFKACIADTVGSDGFYVSAASADNYFEQCVGTYCFGHQFVVTASTFNHFVQCVAQGRNQLAAPPANMCGWYIAAASAQNRITGGMSRYNTLHGVYQLGGSVGLNMSGTHLWANTQYGLVTAAGSYSLTTGCQFIGNGVGNGLLGAAIDQVGACQNNAGALFNFTGPGAF